MQGKSFAATRPQSRTRCVRAAEAFTALPGHAPRSKHSPALLTGSGVTRSHAWTKRCAASALEHALEQLSKQILLFSGNHR
jgi:hypothetical protein